MIEVPDFLVPIEIAEKLKEIGFDKKVHFFFLYYQGWEMLKKRGDKYGFITSNSCNPNIMFNYNLKENHLSIPTWSEAIDWFEELDPKISIDVRRYDTRKNEQGKRSDFVENVFSKHEINSDFIYFSTVYAKSFFTSIRGDEKTSKTYDNKKDILIVAINKAIDFYKIRNEKE